MTMTKTAELATLDTIPLTEGSLQVSTDATEKLVALRPACDQLGIDYSRQLRKLKDKHWATVDMKTTVGADGKQREMSMVTRDTFTMWLATIEPSRVNEAARPTLIAFQKEAVAALDAYFHEGGIINPRATEDQVQRIAQIANMRMNLIRLAQGVIQPDYLEAQARIILAEGMGKLPELDPEKLPLEVDGYLNARGLSKAHRRKVRGPFGTRLGNAYFAEFGERPYKTRKNVAGNIRPVNVYTEEHRYLFDRIFEVMGLGQVELEDA